MAIRKLRKNMKVPIAIFVVAFIITIISGLIVGIKNYGQGDTYALKINKEKIESIKIERTFSQEIERYRQNPQLAFDDEDIKVLLFDNIVTETLLVQAAKDLKVKVGSKEVNERYKQIKSQFGDKKTFLRALQYQGYTNASFKKDVKKNLVVNMVRDKILNDAKVSEEEVKEHYENNKYEMYLGKTFEEAKGDIEKSLLESKKREHYNFFVENLYNEANIEWAENGNYDAYKKYEKQVVYEKEGYKFTNVEFINRKQMLLGINMMYGITDAKVTDEDIKKMLDKEAVVASYAKEQGLEENTNLVQEDRIKDLIQKLRYKLIADAKIDENQMKEYFEKNAMIYDIPESANINIIEMNLIPSAEDEKAAEEKAKKILEDLKGGENFAKLAMAYSDDGSSSKGGDLGWFKKGKMIPEFEKAAFEGEIGLYPEVVKTKYGYHIIKVVDKKEDSVKASHILIMNSVGENTKKTALLNAEKLAEKLNKKEVTFEEAAKNNSKLKTSEIKNILKGEMVPYLGKVPELNKEIFVAEDNKAKALLEGNRLFIFERMLHVPFEKAEYEKTKDRVKYDMAKQEASIKLGQLTAEKSDE